MPAARRVFSLRSDTPSSAVAFLGRDVHRRALKDGRRRRAGTSRGGELAFGSVAWRSDNASSSTILPACPRSRRPCRQERAAEPKIQTAPARPELESEHLIRYAGIAQIADSVALMPCSNSPLVAHQFNLDLKGRLRNLKLSASRPLMPVFEALVNSLHAIDEAKRAGGHIIVEVVRRSGSGRGDQLALADGTRQPIIGFRITDNGIGFTAENFDSFRTSDSLKKEAIGGRGIGRLTWLKAFKAVSVDSEYKSDTDEWRRRTFRFTVAAGVSDEKDVPSLQTAAAQTVVMLKEPLDPYAGNIPKRTSTIAQHIVDHCFVAIHGAEKAIRFELVDGDERVDIAAQVRELFSTALVDNVTVCDREFQVTHLRLASPELAMHKLTLMADGREVRAENLNSMIPQLRAKLEDEARTFWWWALVQSPALNDAVSSDREGFVLPDDASLPNILSLRAIREAVVQAIAKRVDPLIAPIKERARDHARRFVEVEAPQYRHVLQMRPDAVEALSPDLPKDKLDSELHRLNYELEAESRARGAKILSAENFDPAAYEQFLTDENVLGKANLAKYVVHRRRVLDLFRKALKQAPDGKYSLERVVHQLIFPLRKTSDDVPYEQLNLWMIDERLAYHYYLASDKELSSVGVLENDSDQRPDIIIFNAPFAFSDHDGPFTSIVLVEFKRPARDDYNDEKNPIRQVYEYISQVRAGKAKDRAGRPMHIPASVPFYCYIVCDLTPKIAESAEYAGLTATPDAEGYFGFNPNLRAYVEVLSFTKVVNDAEKRNRVLFEKLNLPPRQG